jgi:hypothetical protein
MEQQALQMVDLGLLQLVVAAVQNLLVYQALVVMDV